MPKKRPYFGIIEGDWDREKVDWENCHWEGLKERFQQNKDWEETIYYRKGIEKIETGEKFRPLNGENTKENFLKYLKSLDSLYKDIENNGYDQSKPITVNIGRNGEYLCHQGNHTRIISIILNIDEIPLKIKYRHRKWQKKRNVATKNSERLTKEELKHPDIQKLIKTPKDSITMNILLNNYSF